MKRDCGEGPLIPIRYEVVHCLGASDREQAEKFTALTQALDGYITRKVALEHIPFSNVRLYACDKQGYMNVVKSAHAGPKCEWTETDRTHEL